MKAAVQAKIFAAAFYLHSGSIQKSNLPLGYNFQLSFWLSMCMMLPKPKLSNLPFTNYLLNVIMSCKHTTPFFLCFSYICHLSLGAHSILLDTFWSLWHTTGHIFRFQSWLPSPVPNFQSIQIWLFLCRLGSRSVIKFWCSRNRLQLISKTMFVFFFCFTEPYIFITTIFSCFISVRMLRQLIFSSRISQSQFCVQYGGGDQ